MLRAIIARLPKEFSIVCLLLTTGVTLLSNAAAAQPSYPLPAKRIVALSPHSVELLFALGVGERIIATTEHGDYPQKASQIERIGGYHGIQIERIVELQPDLIVAWQGGNQDQELDKLESLGLRVYRSETKNLYGIVDELKVLASYTGTESKANVLSRNFYQNLEALRNSYQDATPVPFFYQLWQQPLRTMASGSWISEVFELCGGQNIIDSQDYSNDYPQISLETVLLKKPSAIFIPTEHGTQTQAANIWNNWRSVPAVEQGNLFFVDGDLLHRFSLRILDGAEKVCQLLNQVRSKQ